MPPAKHSGLCCWGVRHRPPELVACRRKRVTAYLVLIDPDSQPTTSRHPELSVPDGERVR